MSRRITVTDEERELLEQLPTVRRDRPSTERETYVIENLQAKLAGLHPYWSR